MKYKKMILKNKNDIKKENKGQTTVELILIISFILMFVISLNISINNENELNIAIQSARDGANEGIATNGLAIFSKESYNEYEENENKTSITIPKNIQIIKIETKKVDLDNDMNKTRIQIKVYASAENLKTKSDKNSAGDRINYYIRKAITKSFKTEEISNKLYNPAFSNNYEFTTANVEWI